MARSHLRLHRQAGLRDFASVESASKNPGGCMVNATRKWRIWVTVAIAAVAASCGRDPSSPDARSLSMRANILDSFSVLITPTHSVPPRVQCHWTATVTGGVSPYHYAWTANNIPVGLDSPNLAFTNNGGSFHLVVTVTDATTAQTFDSKVITVFSGATCT